MTVHIVVLNYCLLELWHNCSCLYSITSCL